MIENVCPWETPVLRHGQDGRSVTSDLSNHPAILPSPEKGLHSKDTHLRPGLTICSNMKRESIVNHYEPFGTTMTIRNYHNHYEPVTVHDSQQYQYGPPLREHPTPLWSRSRGCNLCLSSVVVWNMGNVGWQTDWKHSALRTTKVLLNREWSIINDTLMFHNG